MGSQYQSLTKEDTAFINAQHLLYMASCSKAAVNLSPKGLDSLRVINDTTVLYLDLPGSGNRTATDIRNNGEITLLFNAFEGDATILRLFCTGELIEKSDARFHTYAAQFTLKPSQIRRVMLFHIYAVERSCGMGVPIMTFKKEREGLRNWIIKQDEKGTLESYIKAHETPPKLKNLS